LKGYDEPEILRSQLSRFGPISADAGQQPSQSEVAAVMEKIVTMTDEIANTAMLHRRIDLRWRRACSCSLPVFKASHVFHHAAEIRFVDEHQI
jgi:hypothetical protein